MLKLNAEQHAQILGFALIGFGLGWTLDVVAALWKLTQIPNLSDVGLQASIQGSLGWELVLLIGRATITVAAGLVIRTMMSDPKVFGLLFVFVSIYVFPLGTLLSIYVLVYLFAIYPGEFESGSASIISN